MHANRSAQISALKEPMLQRGLYKTNGENQSECVSEWRQQREPSWTWFRFCYTDLCFFVDFSTEMEAANQRPRTLAFTSGMDHWTLHYEV